MTSPHCDALRRAGACLRDSGDKNACPCTRVISMGSAKLAAANKEATE